MSEGIGRLDPARVAVVEVHEGERVWMWRWFTHVRTEEITRLVRELLAALEARGAPLDGPIYRPVFRNGLQIILSAPEVPNRFITLDLPALDALDPDDRMHRAIEALIASPPTPLPALRITQPPPQDYGPAPLLTPTPEERERSRTEALAALERLAPEKIAEIGIVGDGLGWNWSADADGRHEAMAPRLEAFLRALGPEHVSSAEPLPGAQLDYEPRHMVRIEVRDPEGPQGEIGRRFRFGIPVLRALDEDAPLRVAVEGLLTEKAPTTKAFRRTPPGPPPPGATPSPFYREETGPPGQHPRDPHGPYPPGYSYRIGPRFEAVEIANWFLRRDGVAVVGPPTAEGLEGNGLTAASLQALAYLAHGWHLWTFAAPLLRTPFLAGPEGPVHPDLALALAPFGASPVRTALWSVTGITSLSGVSIHFDTVTIAGGPRVEELLEFVAEVYGAWPESRLVALVRAPEGAWTRARSRALAFDPEGVDRDQEMRDEEIRDVEIRAEFTLRAEAPGAPVFRPFRYDPTPL